MFILRPSPANQRDVTCIRVKLDYTDGTQPHIHFELLPNYDQHSWALSIFGAQTANIESLTLVCGGVGQDPSAQGQSMACLAMNDKSLEAYLVDLGEKVGQLPF